MGTVTDAPSWSERQRLEFVERLLFWKGAINRRDLVAAFGISAPQATNDLVTYSTLAAGNCSYNVRTKRYEATGQLRPILIQPDFLRDVRKLGSAVWPSLEVDFFREAIVPQRTHQIEIAQMLCRAAHAGQSIEVSYFSVQSGGETWRRISPRAFASDGLRVHVRAYCHRNDAFRDFVLGRMSAVRDVGTCPFTDRVDAAWQESVAMEIVPNPELKPLQRRGLELDYGMDDGRLVLKVPKAMRIYTARRLGFVEDPQKGLPMVNELKQLVWVA